MSLTVVARSVRAPERRDILGAPWLTGETVPSPLQDTLGRYNPDDTLRVAACVACMGMRAGALQQMPLKAYRDSGGVGAVLNPQPSLLVSPSPASKVPSIWKVRMSISRDAFGYALGVINAVDGAGYPKIVDWVPAQQTKPRPINAYGELEWRINNELWDSQRLVHIPSRWVTNEHPEGIAPLRYSGLLDLAKRVQEYGQQWFDQGGIPAAVLYSDQELTLTQAEGILTRIKARWSRRQPAVLGAGMKYEPVAVPANQSEWLQTATRVAADIAISFSMPPEKIGAAIAGQSVTYANRDQAQQQWLIDGINPDLTVIAEHMTLLFPPAVYVKWTTAAILQSDAKTRAEVNAIRIKSGSLTPDEERSLEDQPPLTEEQQLELDRAAERVKPRPAGAPTLDEAAPL